MRRVDDEAIAEALETIEDYHEFRHSTQLASYCSTHGVSEARRFKLTVAEAALETIEQILTRGGREMRDTPVERKLSAIQRIMRTYHKRRKSSTFAFEADTYGHEKTVLREKGRALDEIDKILRSAHTTH